MESPCSPEQNGISHIIVWSTSEIIRIISIFVTAGLAVGSSHSSQNPPRLNRKVPDMCNNNSTKSGHLPISIHGDIALVVIPCRILLPYNLLEVHGWLCTSLGLVDPEDSDKNAYNSII